MNARSRSIIAALVFASGTLGCASRASVDGTSGADSGLDGPSDDANASDSSTDETSTVDTGTTSPDTVPPGDGGVRRLPCAGRTTLANDLPPDMPGALEGELVSIVPPGTPGGCPQDSSHLHLQVAVGTKRYDVAITLDSTTGGAPLAIFTKDRPPSSAAPGWSSATFDFVTDLGAHSTDFAPLSKTDLLARLEKELATVSKVSIHGKSYTDGTGLHDVHRNGFNHDGVIIARGAGASGMDHAIALRFSNNVF